MPFTNSQSQFVSVCTRLTHKALCAVTFAILFMFASFALSQTIMTVQHNSGYVASGTSVAVAYTSNVTSGNLILMAESTYDGVSIQTPMDTLGNSFTQLVTNALQECSGRYLRRHGQRFRSRFRDLRRQRLE